MFFKLGPNEKCVKGMEVRKQGWDEEVHHIPHTWVNSCREAGFSRVVEGVFHNLRTQLGKFMQRGRVGGASHKPG